MMMRFLLFFSAVSFAAAQTATPAKPTFTQAPVIRFEDASDKAGINFTHSFGSRQLGVRVAGEGFRASGGHSGARGSLWRPFQ